MRRSVSTLLTDPGVSKAFDGGKGADGGFARFCLVEMNQRVFLAQDERACAEFDFDFENQSP